MPKLHINRFDEYYEEYREPDNRRNGSRRRLNYVDHQFIEQADGAGSFEFSYHASRHERLWIVDSLGGFYEGQWIRDVLRQVKGGKEASVYQCRAGVAAAQERYLAAKIYRPRPFRALKKDHLYREGRSELDEDGNVILDDRMIHAMQKRTQYGKEVMHTSWIEHEYQALVRLNTAGADVPLPYARGNNAILMGYIGGVDIPAPALSDIELEPIEALTLFRRVLRNIEIMLELGLVHADLSAYNILYWDGKITLIDFPQAISPHENRNAYRLFERDVIRVCEYFSRQGVRSNPPRLAAEMWTRFKYRMVPDVHPRLLDEQSEADRAYWRSLSDE
jgi:RIO kinase 1